MRRTKYFCDYFNYFFYIFITLTSLRINDKFKKVFYARIHSPLPQRSFDVVLRCLASRGLGPFLVGPWRVTTTSIHIHRRHPRHSWMIFGRGGSVTRSASTRNEPRARETVGGDTQGSIRDPSDPTFRVITAVTSTMTPRLHLLLPSDDPCGDIPTRRSVRCITPTMKREKTPRRRCCVVSDTTSAPRASRKATRSNVLTLGACIILLRHYRRPFTTLGARFSASSPPPPSSISFSSSSSEDAMDRKTFASALPRLLRRSFSSSPFFFFDPNGSPSP